MAGKRRSADIPFGPRTVVRATHVQCTDRKITAEPHPPILRTLSLYRLHLGQCSLTYTEELYFLPRGTGAFTWKARGHNAQAYALWTRRCNEDGAPTTDNAFPRDHKGRTPLKCTDALTDGPTQRMRRLRMHAYYNARGASSRVSSDAELRCVAN